MSEFSRTPIFTPVTETFPGQTIIVHAGEISAAWYDVRKKAFSFQIKQYIDGDEDTEDVKFFHPLTTFKGHLSRDKELLLYLASAASNRVIVERTNNTERSVVDVRGQGASWDRCVEDITRWRWYSTAPSR